MEFCKRCHQEFVLAMLCMLLISFLLTSFSPCALAADDDWEVINKRAENGDVLAQQKLCVGDNPYMPNLLWCYKAMENGDDVSKQKYLMRRQMDDCGHNAVLAEREKAQSGDLSSQVAFAKESYTGGCGIPHDYAEAYFWLSLVARSVIEKDKVDYVFWRDDAAKHLTLEQRQAVDKRIEEWTPTLTCKTPDNCKDFCKGVGNGKECLPDGVPSCSNSVCSCGLTCR